MIVLTAGFVEPVASAQSTFRAILASTARPGSLQPIEAVVVAPKPLSPGAAALALTLCDQDTPVWLDAALRETDAVPQWLRFHCGAKIVEEPSAASFAFAANPAGLPAFERFNLGTDEYPDRSTTIVCLVETFQSGPTLVLSGPGICERQSFRAAPLPTHMSERLNFNRSLFPRGIDLLLVSADEIIALPRSVRVVSDGDAPCM